MSEEKINIISLYLNKDISESILYKGNILQLELLPSIPINPPKSGKGMALYISGGTLKIAAWTGTAWVTT
jgi:hypothetical protein